MTDIVDMTNDEFFPSERRESPYGSGPFKEPNRLCILGRTEGGLYFVKFMRSGPPNARPVYSGQRWTVLKQQARRFEDVRLAGEFAKFAESLPDAPRGQSVVVWVEEGNPLPQRSPNQQVVVPEPGMSVGKWLTTYSGKGF